MRGKSLSEDEQRAVKLVRNMEVDIFSGELRHHVAKCLRTSPRSVSRVMATAAALDVDVLEMRETRGRKRIVYENTIMVTRRILLRNARSRDGIPSSTRNLRDELADQQTYIGTKTIYRTVRKIGF